MSILSLINYGTVMEKNSLLYLLPIYILSKVDMSQFFIFSSGLITGAYLAQNYNLPDVKNKIVELLDQLKTMEKDHNKSNNK